uniref:Putative ubiquitin fusion degradation protein n=1 Tax=Trypanosoma congolense (strain IL3000) TaxID=1068625 RepID=G0UWX5_TRYCI|nr:putative ubiquitin fusion degradation protein [Trypanosoma congolense IL3000]
MKAVDVFEKRLRAFSSNFAPDSSKIDGGGRVLLPPGCLEELSKKSVAYPLQFRIEYNGRVCYGGVLEFIAEEGTIIMPDWMFSTLMLEPNKTVSIKTCTLLPGSLVKLRPQQSQFIELSDPRYVLEMHLSQYPVLTRGTTIVLNYLDIEFLIDVIDITNDAGQSLEAISTVRADSQATEVKVVFERPLDMPPSPTEREPEAFFATDTNDSNNALNFSPLEFTPPTIGGGVAGGANMKNTDYPKEKEKEEEKKPSFIPFVGKGCRLNEGTNSAGGITSSNHSVHKTPEELALEVREKRLKALARTLQGTAGHPKEHK